MMEVVEEIVKGIAKVIWKTFLITIWGCCRLLESIFHLINENLKKVIK